MKGMVRTFLFLPLVAAVVVSCRPSLPTAEDGVFVQRGGDLVASRDAVTIRDTVPGDVLAAGGDIVFAGAAGGDLVVASARQRLGGTAAGSVRAAGAEVRIGAQVGRNVTAAGRLVVLERPARVAGNSYLVGQTVRLEGAAEGLVRIGAQNVALNGTMAGDVLVEASRLRVGPDAVIEGDLRYRLSRGQEPEVDPAARIEGTIHPLSPRPRLPVRATLRVLALLGFLVAGAVVVALLPGLAHASGLRIRARPVVSVLGGLGLLLLVPVVIVLVAITVIGVPLALVAAALYGVAVYLAPVVVGLWLGRLVLRGSTYPERGELVGAFLLGGALIGLLGFIPWAGPVILALATVVGLGAFAVALWEGALEVQARRE